MHRTILKHIQFKWITLLLAIPVLMIPNQPAHAQDTEGILDNTNGTYDTTKIPCGGETTGYIEIEYPLYLPPNYNAFVIYFERYSNTNFLFLLNPPLIFQGSGEDLSIREASLEATIVREDGQNFGNGEDTEYSLTVSSLELPRCNIEGNIIHIPVQDTENPIIPSYASFGEAYLGYGSKLGIPVSGYISSGNLVIKRLDASDKVIKNWNIGENDVESDGDFNFDISTDELVDGEYVRILIYEEMNGNLRALAEYVLEEFYRNSFKGDASPSQSFEADACNKLEDPEERDACLRCLFGDPPPDKPTGDDATGAIWTELGCIDPSPAGIITRIFQIGIGVMGGVAVLRFMQIAIAYQSKDPEKVKEAKEMITSLLMGIVLLAGGIVLLQFIGINVLGLPEGFLGG